MRINDKKGYESDLEFEQMIQKIVRAHDEEKLTIFIGAGISISQGFPTWDGYVEYLIQYWMFNLKNLITDRTVAKKVKIEDIGFLKRLLKLKKKKKRKIDLVHQLIREYTEVINDIEESEKHFSANVLNFEKEFFKEVELIEKKNEVLEELVKLDSTFITTNYDAEISKHIEISAKMNWSVINSVNELPKNVKTKSVIHLHGNYESDYNYFVNSSTAYSKLYYRENEKYKEVKKLLSKENEKVVIFIGCSMEEEEILALLSEEQNNGYYALMRRDEDESYNKKIRSMYRDNKGVEIIWYGTKFEELNNFVKKIVVKVLKENHNKTQKDLDMTIILGGEENEEANKIT